MAWLESAAILRGRKCDPTILLLLVWVRGGMWLISAQHEVVMMQLAFRFQTNMETRQLIPGQWEDCIKWSPSAWLGSDAIVRER